MRYVHVVEAQFIRRRNRFVADVWLNGREETVHVRNTGRCVELLLPGVRVVLECVEPPAGIEADSLQGMTQGASTGDSEGKGAGKGRRPARKTAYSLIAVYKDCLLINIDSQAPNKVVEEALRNSGIAGLGTPAGLRAEVTYGASRFDFAWPLLTSEVSEAITDNVFHASARRNASSVSAYLEVKGVTLESEGIVRFPDAPTVRGAKHVRELIEAVKEGQQSHLLFVIQMRGVSHFEPNASMDPRFAEVLREASQSGVKLWAFDCSVAPDELLLGDSVEIRL